MSTTQIPTVIVEPHVIEPAQPLSTYEQEAIMEKCRCGYCGCPCEVLADRDYTRARIEYVVTIRQDTMVCTAQHAWDLAAMSERMRATTNTTVEPEPKPRRPASELVFALCVVCSEPIDYCPGHGELG